MKRILILEDNETVLSRISTLIQEIDAQYEICGFHNVKDAYQCALERAIDLFLIDIILDVNTPGDTSGLYFVENIRRVNSYMFTPVIFITSLEDARLYTYENLHCYSFLEKPFDAKRLKQLVMECLQFQETKSLSKTLYFRKDGIILAVEREDIVYAECMNHIMYIHTGKRDVLSIPYTTVKKLMQDIDSADFIQCSRNTVVNKKYIQNIDIPNRMIQFIDDYGRVEIGITFKKYLRDL